MQIPLFVIYTGCHSDEGGIPLAAVESYKSIPHTSSNKRNLILYFLTLNENSL